MKSHRPRVNSITISGRSPPLYCTLTSINMYGHQNKSRLSIVTLQYSIFGQAFLYREIKLKLGFGVVLVIITIKHTGKWNS